MANPAGILTVLISLALVAGLGCDTSEAPSGEPTTPAAANTVWVSGGWLDHDPGSILHGAHNNSSVVRARVSRVDAPESYDLPNAPNATRMAFTPVEFVVTESLRGDVQPDDRLTLRILGGTIGGVEYIDDDAPSAGAFVVGDEFLLFTQEVITLGGIAAATPTTPIGSRTTARSMPSRAATAST